MVNVTDRITVLMQDRGWSEYRLRKETQLPASTIANIFHRNTVPSLVTLECICDAFGICILRRRTAAGAVTNGRRAV